VPAVRPDLKPRLPVDALLVEERYPDDATMLALIDGYDASMAGYYERRGLSGRNWSGGVLRKNAVARRQGLLDYYRSKGARLDGGDPSPEVPSQGT
jgi:FMN reductase (NADPH)